MKNLIFTLSIFILFSQCKNPGHEQSIIDLSTADGLRSLTAGINVQATFAKTNTGPALEMTISTAAPLAQITFHRGKTTWKLSRYQYIAADITNPGKEDVLVELRPQQDAWLGSGQIIPASKTRTIRTPIIRDLIPQYITKRLFGMNALPGNIIKMWGNLDPDSIKSLAVVVIEPSAGTILQISSIRGEKAFAFPKENELNDSYFPLVDEFGQLIKKDWPGKMHSLDELKDSATTEEKDIAAHTAPVEWDQWGGWATGPQLKATGHFRTEKVNGKWWLVDPDGRLFWSHGMGTVNLGEATPITERAHYFKDLPDSSQIKTFYSIGHYSPKGYYKGRSMQMFHSYAWNLFRKYGDNWQEHCRELAHRRLQSWGMNTIGGWSDPAIFNLRKTPFTETLGSNSRRIEGSEGQWYKFPDPYDKSLSQAITAGVERIKQSATDPYCIGYFVDNELYWGDNKYIAKAVIKSPKEQQAKAAMLQFLKNKYKTIKELNKNWGSNFTGWDDFLNSKEMPAKETSDIFLFSEQVADQYFKVIKETLKKVAPHKLYLGCRFDFHYYPAEDTTGAWAVRIAGKYCDVVSFNRYRYSAIDLIPGNADKPIIIGEWHMGSLDRGMLHFSLRFADDQKNRAEMYTYYIKSCLENPYIVGTHWFEYGDEPTLGRFDGENYNTGFVDVCDNPYTEMIEASRKMGAQLYQVREESVNE